jgi:flagellar biosynthesis GTPase FlhF
LTIRSTQFTIRRNQDGATITKKKKKATRLVPVAVRDICGELLRNENLCGEGGMFEQIAPLLQVYLILTPSAAECERGVSLLKLTKSPRRNRMSQATLEQLMTIKINGAPVGQFDLAMAATFFFSEKTRRVKVAGVYTHTPAPEYIWGDHFVPADLESDMGSDSASEGDVDMPDNSGAEEEDLELDLAEMDLANAAYQKEKPAKASGSDSDGDLDLLDSESDVLMEPASAENIQSRILTGSAPVDAANQNNDKLEERGQRKQKTAQQAAAKKLALEEKAAQEEQRVEALTLEQRKEEAAAAQKAKETKKAQAKHLKNLQALNQILPAGRSARQRQPSERSLMSFQDQMPSAKVNPHTYTHPLPYTLLCAPLSNSIL